MFGSRTFIPIPIQNRRSSEGTSFDNRWQNDVVGMLEEKHGKSKVSISFECETLKAEKAAEDHLIKFMPKLVGMDAVGKNL
ncbi:hypothetical protein OROMI_030020 [Orobanche minor]